MIKDFDTTFSAFKARHDNHDQPRDTRQAMNFYTPPKTVELSKDDLNGIIKRFIWQAENSSMHCAERGLSEFLDNEIINLKSGE